ncbi:hypothetical protein [Mycolicibacterium nivoides]|uniref:hypothetical protein n=1 Tax=Mycolicibacterium nivoides TaxID=2487344 RepID=UPI003C2D9484
MNERHARDLAYGAYLLVGRVRDSGDQIISLIEQDVIDQASLTRSVDGLVTLTAYLVNRAVESLGLEEDLLHELIPEAIKETLGSKNVDDFLELIGHVRAGEFPNSTDLAATGVIAQEVSLALCMYLAEYDDVHPGAYLKGIRRRAERTPNALSLANSAKLAESKQTAADDGVSNSVREKLLIAILEALHTVAQAQRIVDQAPDPDAVLAVNTIVDFTYTAARIGTAIYELARQKHTYGAIALLRQLVEFEYLLWAFNQHPESINDWATSDRGTRERSWTPSAIRSRAGTEYRRIDYTAHCEIGGHPTPEGLTWAYPDTHHALIHADLASHLHSIWAMLTSLYGDLAEASLLPKNHVDIASMDANIETLFEEWITLDKVRYISFYR